MRTVGVQVRDSRSARKEIYLCEAGERVGPFCSREDAEKFIELMELFGASSEGIEIVELESDSIRRGGPKQKKPASRRMPNNNRAAGTKESNAG